LLKFTNLLIKDTKNNKTKNAYTNNVMNNIPEDFDYKNLKKLTTYSIASLLTLIVSVLLLTFDQRLIAGCLILLGACLGFIAVKEALMVTKKCTDLINEFSSLNDKKDDVITEFSHKIREPLNNLVVVVDILMESGLNAKQKELLETFIASTDNMVTTVNELTMQSAGSMSHETRKAIKFNLISTIQNTIEFHNLKEKSEIDFILNKKDTEDFECFGDPIKLKQIFLDLFNTIDSHKSDRVSKVAINITNKEDLGNKKAIIFRIQTDDNYPLIDNLNNKRSLAETLIASEKGSFTQNIGTNSTVLTILLTFDNPVSETRQKIGSSKIEELIKKDKIHKDLSDLKILLVEDNLINQKITLLTLKPLVFSIDTASNGKEALDKFGTSSYDLILMDIQMPIMSGLVAAEKIRALEATTNTHVPIIAITANAMIGDKEKCLSVGIDDYISKPFQPSALIEKIKKII
jgi:CheY-like chemotaxis protein